MTVVELFTSEGCSSCPPAEALLRELVARPSLLALEIHVDYWDALGWKDPFAAPAHTARQRAYAARVSGGQLYTPQMVINGHRDVIGSRRTEVDTLLRQSAPLPVRPVIRQQEGAFHVDLPESPAVTRPLTLWRVTYDLRQEVSVGRGENAGRRLVHSNVVRSLTVVGDWAGQAASLPLTPPEAGQGMAVLIQDGSGGPLAGAARWKPPE